MAHAHPGRTDANGGHTCRTNCGKWGLKNGEYHYHNGGGSSSSSSKTTNYSSSPSSYTSQPKEATVEVKRPDFNLYINNELINNSSAKYPVFVYKDITYFPMTWNYTQALGLETKWSSETGFSIRKSDNKPAKLTQETGQTSSKLNAKFPKFNVYVNDSWVDNANEEYPLLVLNDVIYFPMTWKYAVEELGLSIKFDNNSFNISK